ncbi:coiled-coil domain-containing protein 116 [Rhineura floridana]|uniref:coiled-coil domain-containing protein 116 n=1 Tax=Rhineura floridana TaxID=261503 RepID=UPI002AC800EE|nr:coiled-coil domain-containing protein 116 [Rhineura floridana]XP_061458979.1 coiled-coil domain-containing protein 116 [Rhineura floridana]
MVSRRYSGYLADDESLRGPQLRHLDTSQRQDACDWGSLLRPPSRCQFRDQFTASTASAYSAFTRSSKGKRKQRAESTRESSHLANEFSEFVDFLADEEVLDSLQNIVEDAVQKLRQVTTEDGEHIFDVQEDSASSLESGSWSFSYSSRSRRQTTTNTSSSEDDWETRLQSRRQLKPEGKMCLLDKYAARLPKLERKPTEEVSGGFHAETFSERSGDNYYFRQEHFHIWAKLAESFPKIRPPKKDYFAKFRKEIPRQSLSIESLQKEITNVLKRPTPSSIPLYYPGTQPFQALDFLEENKILAALQDIINQAVLKVLEATVTDGIPTVNLFDDQGQFLMLWDSSKGGSEEEEEMKSGSAASGSVEESSDEGDSKSEDGKSADGGKKKKKKKKGKKKKKAKGESPVTEEKAKPKYTPPPLPKSKRKSMVSEESQRKPKYVPPPLPKSKPRAPPDEPPPKPKYVPPPLPKPKQKKQDSAQAVAESAKQPVVSRHIISPKDIKRARLQGRPIPKQSIIDFLIENAAKLILYKYNYETLLSEKLGFISVPVTKVLLEIMFGYKRVKDSGIRLSSQIDWSTVYNEIYTLRPPKPKTPKHKAGDKKKGKEKKKKAADKQKKSGEKKSVLFKSEMPTGKVVLMKSPVEHDAASSKMRRADSTTEQEDDQAPDIFEIVPPQFPREDETDEISVDGENHLVQPITSKDSVTSALDSPKISVASEDSPTKIIDTPQDSEGPSPPNVSPKQSLSQKLSIAPDNNRGSGTLLPEVESSGQVSGELLKKVLSSRKSSLNMEGSKTLLPKISN